VRTSDRLGGPERLILDQARAAPPGIAHHLASFVRRGREGALLAAARARGLPTHPVAERFAFDPGLVGRLGRLLRRVRPDVIVGHDYKADLLLLLAAPRRPRVVVLHGYTGEDRKVGLLEALDRRLLSRAHTVVAVSPGLAALARRAGLPDGRVHVVPNAVPVEEIAAAAGRAREAVRREWEVAPGRAVLVSVGRLSPEKGQDVLLEAFARAARETDALLVLVGDGALRDRLERRARAADLAGRVRFLGWRTDPYACLGGADVCVLPSRSEGLPLSLLEAMSAGLPVVATAVGSVPDVLEGGARGRLVPPADAEALADALLPLLTDPDSRRELGARARERAREYDLPAFARRWDGIYRSVAAPGAPPA
jgi:glycosyltransferase involved in cell wall biosynthesis